MVDSRNVESFSEDECCKRFKQVFGTICGRSEKGGKEVELSFSTKEELLEIIKGSVIGSCLVVAKNVGPAEISGLCKLFIDISFGEKGPIPDVEIQIPDGTKKEVKGENFSKVLAASMSAVAVLLAAEYAGIHIKFE